MIFFRFSSCRQLSCAFFCFFSRSLLRRTLQDSKIPSKTCNCHQKSRFRYFEKIKLLSPLGYHFGWHLGHMGPTLGSAWAPWAPFGGPWAPKGAQKSEKSAYEMHPESTWAPRGAQSAPKLQNGTKKVPKMREFCAKWVQKAIQNNRLL